MAVYELRLTGKELSVDAVHPETTGEQDLDIRIRLSPGGDGCSPSEERTQQTPVEQPVDVGAKAPDRTTEGAQGDDGTRAVRAGTRAQRVARRGGR